MVCSLRTENYGRKGGHRIYKIYKGCVGYFYFCVFIWPAQKSNFFKSPPSCQALPVYLANTATKIRLPITNIMLSRRLMHCDSISYILSFSSICTVLLSWSKIFGLMISIAMLFRFPSILDSIFCVGKPI